MKRLFTLFTGLCVMLLAGCNDEYDDSALVKRLDDFEQRLERLERLCNDMNTNLGSMQTIVTALDRGDYITSVEPLTENGSMVGYTIRFAKGTPIVVSTANPARRPSSPLRRIPTASTIGRSTASGSPTAARNSPSPVKTAPRPN